MKKIKQYILILIMIPSLILTNGCELEEANLNQNDVTEVPTNVLLPYAEQSLARLMIGTTQVMAGIFMQYYEGVENHPLPIQTYRIDESLYVDWNFQDYYNNPMINLQKMIEVAQADGTLPHYEGIGKTLMALCLGNLTSMWGDIPYSKALKGSDELKPIYDSQESIYESIQSLLDDAILNFESENEGLNPGADDLLFGGDIERWKRTAYALKARYYMHLTKRTADLSYDPAVEATTAVSNAMISNTDNLTYHYGYSAAEQSPFYSYARLGYIKPNTSFTMLMFGKGDPRDTLYYAIKYGQANMEDLYYTSKTSPVHMITYYELKFIEAEARLRVNVNDPLAQTALEEAISANMKLISGDNISDVDITTYVTNNATLTGDFDSDLEMIITQKYIAMFASIESWTDYRRTGYPILTPTSGGDHNQNPGGEIPRRLIYGQNERLYNEDNYVSVSLQDRFWWDQE